MTTYNIDYKSGGTETSPTIPGKASISLPKNTVNTTSTSLALTGQGVSLYGEYQQENFIRLLENFASKTAPTNPTIGQLWYDTVNQRTKVYALDQTWQDVAQNVVISSTAPTSTVLGQLWFNTAEHILYMNKGATGFSPKYPRYHGGIWAQVWPHVVPYAGLTEHNALATRLNKVIGTPSTSGTDPDVANNQWGWGETDIIPTYTDSNVPSSFDNNAWVIFVSRLMKAVRHIDQSFFDESTITASGFILDGRGNANATALSYSPARTWQHGWQLNGIVTVAGWYTTMLNALAALETNRFSIATLDTTWASLNSTNRPSWAVTKVYDAQIQFTSEENAKRFFNSAGQLRFNISLTGHTTGNAQNWHDLFTNTGTNVDDYTTAGFVIDYKGCKLGPTGAYIGGASSIGYYDLTTSYQTLHTVARGGAYGAGGLTFEAKTSTTGGWTVDVRITFTEDLDVGFKVDGTTTVALQIRKSTGAISGSPTISTPVISNPTVTVSGTFVTAPAE